MPTKKVWNHATEMKNGFVSREEKVYVMDQDSKG